MAELTPEEQQAIIRRLAERGAQTPCPRCGNPTFSIVAGYFNNPLQPDLNVFNLGGPSVPAAVVACTRCGFLAQHALGVLGLLPSLEKPT